MITRRNILLGVGAGVVLRPMLPACTSRASEQDAARLLRSRITTGTSDSAQLMRELIRYATLAPSSHSSQRAEIVDSLQLGRGAAHRRRTVYRRVGQPGHAALVSQSCDEPVLH